MATTKAQSHTTTDHEEIQRWAEERGAKPACVKGTGGPHDIGMLRLDFPGYSGEDSLQHIAWDDWFEKFDERGLALLFQEQTAAGEQSNFNKLVSRETAAENENKSHRAGGGKGNGSKSSRGSNGGAQTKAGKSKSSSGASGSKRAGSQSKSSAKKTTSKKASSR